MDRIEIRQDRKKMIGLISLTLVGYIGISWYIFFSGRIAYNSLIVILYLLGAILMCYQLYQPVRRVLNNQPVLVLTKIHIIIHDRSDEISILWSQVITWKIEKDEGNYYLSITSADAVKRVCVSMLDKKPAEIEILISEFTTTQ